MSPRVVAAALLLTACGSETAGPRETGDRPTTARALAAVAEEYAGEPDSASQDEPVDEFGKDSLGVDLRYGATGVYDGEMLAIAVSGRSLPEWTACEPSDRLCAETPDGTLIWEEVAPEEDPGTIVVITEKDGGRSTVLVIHSGPPITGDPRELDLAISVADMFAIANDPRVDVTTTQEALDRGEQLGYWKGS